MFTKVWPTKINTPHIPLGIPLSDGIEILRSISENIIQENDGKEISYKVVVDNFSVAIYEKSGLVNSVWYDDPVGRLFSFSKRKKLRMYLNRYTLKAVGKGD